MTQPTEPSMVYASLEEVADSLVRASGRPFDVASAAADVHRVAGFEWSYTEEYRDGHGVHIPLYDAPVLEDERRAHFLQLLQAAFGG